MYVFDPQCNFEFMIHIMRLGIDQQHKLIYTTYHTSLLMFQHSIEANRDA